MSERYGSQLKAADTFPVFDGHVDLVYDMIRSGRGAPFNEIDSGPVTLGKMKEGEVRVVVNALYCEDRLNGPDTASAHFLSLLRFAETRLQGLKPIKNRTELEECFGARQRPGVLTLVENADGLLELDWDILVQRSIFVIGLTHAGENRIGQGNGAPNPVGLTSQGKSLIRKISDQHRVIDVAHLSEPCFRDLIRMFDGPLITTHTGLRSFADLPRNLNLDQLRELHERGGVAGITVNPEMLSVEGKATVHDVFLHIDWLVQRFGPEFVALGSDFCGFDTPGAGIEDMSKFPRLAELMMEAGYTPEAVGAIMGGNWLAFYNALLSETDE